jgi:RNA polymerase sigma-70 factor (ECF subfamily)
MSTASDVELLVRWGKGENEAGQALTRRHFVPIRAYFLTKAPYEHAALVKELFARLLAQRSSYSSRSSFRVYVYGIARALLVEHLRRRGGDAALDPLGVSAAALDAGRPAPELSEGSHHRALFDALRQLPLGEQEQLELYYFQGLTAVEIATLVGAREDTVRTALREALGRLGARLGGASSGKLGLDEVEAQMNDARSGLSNLRLVSPTAG